MAIDFPDSPANNDSFTSGGKKWIFNGSTWNLITANSYTISTGEVTTAKIAAGAVTAAKLGNDISLTPADGSITAAKIASNAVTETKIGSGAVTQAKLTSGLSGITITTSSLVGSVITSPFTNQFAFFSDTNVLSRWNGTAWVSGVASAPTEAPTSLALVSATTTTATISFAAGADGGLPISNYQYALSTNSGSTYGSYNALNPADGTTPITITGLTIGTAYYIKLKAVNSQGVSNIESSALSFSTTNLSVEYLVIAGGGGSGYGGGGAGGYRSSVTGEYSGGVGAIENPLSVPLGTYTVTIGAGGSAQTIGSNSVFSSITSTGGGRGGLGSIAGGAGGSGGGRSRDGNGSHGSGIVGQGKDGGTSQVIGWGGAGGGGGAGAVGGSGSGNNNQNGEVGGAGGVGLSSSITGSAVTRAGGGGGGAEGTGGRGAGGSGGGGQGCLGNDSSNTTGTDNTGGGAGGGAGANSGKAGGSGIVIVRYLTTEAAGATITGGTATTSGSYTIRTFLASGSLVIA